MHGSISEHFCFPGQNSERLQDFGGTRAMETTPPPGVAELDISEHTLSVFETEKRQNLQKSKNKAIKRGTTTQEKNENQAA